MWGRGGGRDTAQLLADWELTQLDLFDELPIWMRISGNTWSHVAPWLLHSVMHHRAKWAPRYLKKKTTKKNTRTGTRARSVLCRTRREAGKWCLSNIIDVCGENHSLILRIWSEHFAACEGMYSVSALWCRNQWAQHYYCQLVCLYYWLRMQLSAWICGAVINIYTYTCVCVCVGVYTCRYSFNATVDCLFFLFS